MKEHGDVHDVYDLGTHESDGNFKETGNVEYFNDHDNHNDDDWDLKEHGDVDGVHDCDSNDDYGDLNKSGVLDDVNGHDNNDDCWYLE